MGGLLYKDFLSVKGRNYVYGLLGTTGLLFLLRLLTLHNEGYGTLVGLFFCVVLAPSLILFLPNSLEGELLAIDEGKYCREYVLSLPVTKREYVASKYIFFGIVYCILLGIFMLWGMVFNIGKELEGVHNMIDDVMALLPLLACVSLLINAFELPFFLIGGRKKGERIKISGMVLLFFGILVYMLFGDLTVLQRFDLALLLEYLEKNRDIMILLNGCLPILALGLYYVSYRISGHFFERKEWECED